MTKYEPLRDFLAARSDAELPMSFRDIERIIAAPLPPSAFKHRPWWSNNPSNSVITYAWLAAGYETANVDMGSQKLVFRKTHRGPPAPPAKPSPGGGSLAGLRAALGGTVRFAPGFDAMTPTGETWNAEQE